MKSFDIPAIEARARRLRAEELRRLEGVFGDRLHLVARLAASSALGVAIAASELLRPIFSWNPQATQTPGGAIITQAATHLGRLLFRAFAWNPQARRSS